MKKVLIAGATGYLGGYVAKELMNNSYTVKALVRSLDKIEEKDIQVSEIFQGEITKRDSIKDCCKDIDIVISTVGITRQKDGLTYMDVDYQANMNLLEEAKKNAVKKFIYVSVLNGEHLKNLKICEAKELFVEQLKKSGLEYCIIRPNGFFSDMTEFYMMAKKGRVYLLGDGKYQTNPIHGEDLAKLCVEAINDSKQEIEVGGPETLTHDEIAVKAFEALKIEPKITHIPNWIRISILKIARLFLKDKTYGPIEFFLTVMAMNMVAPEYGKHTLKEYFTKLKMSDKLNENENLK